MTGVRGIALAGSSARVQLPCNRHPPTRCRFTLGIKWPSPLRQSEAKALGSPLCHKYSINSQTLASKRGKVLGYVNPCNWRNSRNRETAWKYLVCVEGATTKLCNVPKARRSVFRWAKERRPITWALGMTTALSPSRWAVSWVPFGFYPTKADDKLRSQADSSHSAERGLQSSGRCTALRQHTQSHLIVH